MLAPLELAIAGLDEEEKGVHSMDTLGVSEGWRHRPTRAVNPTFRPIEGQKIQRD